MASHPETARGVLPAGPADAPDDTAWCESLLIAAGEAAEVLFEADIEPSPFDRALAVLGEAAHASRVHVAQANPDKDGQLVLRPCHEWCARHVLTQPLAVEAPRTPDHPAGSAPTWADALSSGQIVHWLKSSADGRGGQLAVQRGVGSIVLVPFMMQDALCAVVAFEHADEPPPWSPASLNVLRVAARVLGSELQRNCRAQRDTALMHEYRELLESVRDVIFRIDEQGRWRYLSDAWQELTGRTVEASLHRPCAEDFHPDDLLKLATLLGHGAAKHAETCRLELRVRTATGDYRWVQASVRGLSRSGVSAGSLTDIQQAKDVELRLQQARIQAESANKSKSDFLSTMSHELRTPLNAVLGLSEAMLEMEAPLDPERCQRYLRIIHQSGQHLLAQINDILDVARIDAGHMKVDPTPVDLAQVVANAAAQATRSSTSRALDIRTELPAQPVVIWADERHVRQILASLVSNALKFTPDGGTITLRARIDADGMGVAEVADTGIGIAPEDLPRLFKPFSQIDTSVSRQFGGSGLGLAVVDRKARLLGGHASVESEPGKGSTFGVHLPLHVEEKPGRAQLDSREAMVIDDDADRHVLVGDLLRDGGFTVRHFETGSSALGSLSEGRPPSLVVVDINSPGNGGSEIVESLRAGIGPGPRILAVTALAASGDARPLRTAGADAVLTKPVPLATLRATLSELTGIDL